MNKADYIKTITAPNGQEIQLGFDDYGQCYYIVWYDDKGRHEESCGTYNQDYEDYIAWRFEK